MPGWSAHDRLGVLVRRPYGLLGASLLVQAAITLFYDLRRRDIDEFRRRLAPEPERRAIDETRATVVDGGVNPIELAELGSIAYPVYPEIYVLHVGGRHGDHSTMDIWPPNREFEVDDDPTAIARAVNDRALTRLAVPDGPRASVSLDWETRGTLRETVQQAFAYAEDGAVAHADVSIVGTDPAVEENPRATLDMEATIARWAPHRADPSVRRFLDSAEPRLGEVSSDVRRSLRASRERALHDGTPRETYRRIGLQEALDLVGGGSL